MKLGERITYAFWGAVLGVLIGAACWWLYGLAHSINYDGPAMDPILHHWLVWSATSFALVGFLFRVGVIEIIGDAVIAIFHYELNEEPRQSRGNNIAFLFLAVMVATIWFTVPK
ncbi:MAG: hypothetical protein AB1899_10230 [Pseudomonadota bacterium]